MEVTKFWAVVHEKLSRVDTTALIVNWAALKPQLQQLNAANATFVMTLVCAYHKYNNPQAGHIIPYDITDMNGGPPNTAAVSNYTINFGYLPPPLQYIIKLAVDEMVNIST